MNPDDPNVQMVEALLAYLGELEKQFVFVGGCATGLLITDNARPAVRATKDVDVITEVAGHNDYRYLQEQLRQRGFKEDPNSDVLCRWKVGDLQVDIMPTDSRILGFTNQWYREAIATSRRYKTPSGNAISLISPPMFLATKIEAFHERGNQEYGTSHDMEDIVTLIDGRPEIVDEVLNASQSVVDHLQTEIESLLSEPEFVAAINWHLHPDPANQARAEFVIQRLRAIAGI
ncbi:MAG: hypothetical protein H6961_01685 [Chromatiaceae bacterium]|nr:hypothetical protein [Chromatiaceae bacterium]HPE79683.1 hypothetical protein [Gammaproteobacteria bacterium]